MKYFYDGQWRTFTQIESLAKQDGISVDDFIKKYQVKTKSETSSSADRMRTAQSRRLMSQSVFGDAPVEQPKPEKSIYEQTTELIDLVKQKGGYSQDLYVSGDIEKTNENFNNRLNEINTEVGEDQGWNWGLKDSNATEGQIMTWYDNMKPSLSRRYNNLISNSELDQVFLANEDDALNMLKTLLPSEYNVDKLSTFVGGVGRAGTVDTGQIKISVGDEEVVLNSNINELSGISDINFARDVEKAKLFNFLENVRGKTNVDELKYFNQLNIVGQEVYNTLSNLPKDSGGTGLSVKQEQELNYVMAQDEDGNFINNIFVKYEMPSSNIGFIGSTGAGAVEFAQDRSLVKTNPYQAQYDAAVNIIRDEVAKQKTLGTNVDNNEIQQRIQAKARELVVAKLRTDFITDNINDLMQGEGAAEATQKILNKYNVDIDLGSLLKLQSGVQKDKLQTSFAVKNEVANEAYNNFQNVKQAINDPSSRIYQFNAALNNPNQRLIAPNVEEPMVELTRNNQTVLVPESFYKEFVNEEQMLSVAVNSLNKSLDNYYDGLQDLQDANLAWNIYSKNYDNLEKYSNNLLYGSTDIAMGISRALTYSTSFLMPAETRKDMDNFFAEYQGYRVKQGERFYKDLTTGDAFESVGAFGEASAQVVTQQLPNLAAMIFLPTTAAPIVFGVTAAGSKGIEMDYENSLLKQQLDNGQIDLNTYQNEINGGGVYFSKMLGYGLSEGLVMKYFGTLQTVKRGKDLVRNLPNELISKSRNSYLKYVKDQSPGIFKEFGRSTLDELVEENAINIANNLIDGRPLLENAEYVSFASGLFGFGLGGGINLMTTGMSIKKLSDYKTYATMEENFLLETELQNEIDQLEKQNVQLQLDGNQELIDANNVVIEDNRNNIQTIREDNIDKLDGLEKRYKNRGFTKKSWYNFRDGLVVQERLRRKAEDVANNENLSDKQKEKQIKQIKGQMINVQKHMLIFTSVEKFGDAWAGVNMNSSVLTTQGRRNKKIINSYKQKATESLAKEKATISKEAVENRARELYNNDQTSEFVDQTKVLADKLNLNFEAFEDNNDLINFVKEKYDELEQEALQNGQQAYANKLKNKKEKLINGIKKGTINGADISELDLTVVSMTNATSNGLYATSIHEIAHAVFRKILQSTEGGFDVVGDRIIELLEQTNPEILIKIGSKNQNALTITEDGDVLVKDGEEVFATFLELVRTDQVDINALKDANVIGLIGETLNDFAASEGLVDLGVADFTGQDQILNTLFGIDESIKDFKSIPAKVTEESTETKLSETEQVSDLAKINELMPEGVETREDYLNPRVFNPIFRSLISEGGAINTYIRKRSTSQEEVDKRIEAVQDQLMKFDPQAKRKTGETVGSEAFGEFIFAEVDFGGRKARKKLAEEGVRRKREGGDMEVATKTAATTETTAKVDDRKPTLLEEKIFEPTVIEQIKTKVSRIIPTIKQKVDQVISKNKRISPFIAQAKTDISNLAEPIIKKAMGGKANDKLKNFLVDNKPSIVNNLTTTFLMGKDTKGKVLGGIPQAIQKSVGGEFQVNEFGQRVKDDNGNDIFVPNWLSYPDWVGKKADLEKAAATGRTSGADLVRRHPNAANFVTDADILSRFFEDVEVQPDGTITVGEIIRGRKEATAKQLANEIGLEIFEEDMNQKGPMFDMFKESQLMQGAIIADNVASDMRRQIDRGDTKFSETLPDQLLDFVDDLVPQLESNPIKTHNKIIETALAGTSKELNKFLFDSGLIYNFGEGVSGFRRPMLELNWGIYNRLKRLYIETNLSRDGNPQDLQKSLKQTAEGVSKLVDKIDFAAFAGMTPSEVTGFFLSDRGLKLLGKDNKQYKALEKKIKRKVAEGRKEENINKFINKNGFNPKDVRLFNAGYGLCNKMQKILNTIDDTKEQQIEDAYGDQIAAANISNIGLLSYVYEQKLRAIVDNPNSMLGIIRFMELNTSNVKALRALSRLLTYELHEGVSQAPFIDPKTMKGYMSPALSNTKSKEVSDRLVANFTHPHYQLANEAAQAQVTRWLDRSSKKERERITDDEIQKKFNGYLENNLRYKGEHDFASALLNFEIGNLLIQYGNEIQKNPSQKEALIKQFTEEVKQLAIDYDQELGTKILFDIQDEAFSTVSKLSFLRSRADVSIQDSFISPIDGKDKNEIQKEKIKNRDYAEKVSKDRVKAAAVNNSMLNDTKVVDAKTSYSESNSGGLNISNTLDLALDNARGLDKPIKKIRVFDFDDTLARTKSLVFYNRPNTTGKPTPKNKAIFMIGGPGSGKTNIGKGLQLGRDGWKVVNQDIFIEEEKKKAGLPESERGYTPEQRSLRGKIGAAGRKAAQGKLEKYTKAGDGMVIDGTGASYNATMKKVNTLKDQGYEVFMIYAKTSNEVAQERNKARKERSLPAFVVKRTQESVNENVSKYKQDLGNNFIEIDTETLEYGKPLPKDFVADVKAKVHANERGRLTAEEFAEKGAELVGQGFEMDFSDFNIVREGTRGPMFEIAERIRDVRGTEDIFVLTARAPQSAPAIQAFLKSEGLDIPIENITGLGNSTGEAKAEWMVGKASEGYNDFYFTDDAIQNVDAVKTAMEALDVKSKTQQARIKLSETLSRDFNIILEQTTGIEYYKDISKARAQTGVYRQRKFRGFMPASAQDFEGLIYRFLGKGEEGNRQYEWFKENLLDPLNRAEMGMAQDRINLMNDFRELKKNLSVPASLNNNAFGGFKNQDVVRMYIWLSQGMDIPGLSKRDIENVKKHIADNPELMSFAENIKLSLKGNEYAQPGEAWQAGTITTDLMETLNGSIRKGYLKEFSERADIIFSIENLNKIEAIYGPKFRESLENSLQRIKSGRNRIFSNSRLTNNVLDYINNSAGVIMFLNTRSAVLQGISNINFLNWSFNNPLNAGKAFANQPQYWKDFITLMNSPYLLDRRQGLRLNINEAEIANAAKTSKNKAKAAVSWIIQKGYAPTTFMDSFAIASGGATYYRNRINDLMKNEGLSEEEASKKAMEDFREIAEKTQQSSRPDKISQQQAGDLGRLVLAFANTPMQYNRLINKAMLDLANGRGDYKSNISKIIYYGVIQNLIFNSLQQAVFALGFGDEETDEEKEKKYMSVLEGSLDSILRGTGVGGAAIYTFKNVVMDLYERSQRTRPEYVDAVWEIASFSPPIDAKISRLKSAAWYFDSKKRRQEMLDKGFSLDNPAYMAFAKVIAATSNVPLDRALTKVQNISDAFASDTENWMRIAILLGWPKWTLETKEQLQAVKQQKDLEYKKKNLDKFNKWEQESILKQYGLSDYDLKFLKKEPDRINRINTLKEERDTLYTPLESDKPWYIKMKEEGATKEEIDNEKKKRKRVKPLKILKVRNI